jgi:hypothetical protein
MSVPNPVYLVGSDEGRHFIVDRVFASRVKAVDYCESRKNDSYDWHVYEVAPDGEVFASWNCVYKTKKYRRQCPTCKCLLILKQQFGSIPVGASMLQQGEFFKRCPNCTDGYVP